MKFKRLVNQLHKAQSQMDSAMFAINSRVKSVCDFEIHLENVQGDGWCFGAEVEPNNPLYMKMEDVLEVVESTGKFTQDDWKPFS